MVFDSNAFRISALIFALITILILLIQPNLFFNPDGNLKSFGFSYNSETTPIPFGIVIYGILILIYVLCLLIESKLSPMKS